MDYDKTKFREVPQPKRGADNRPINAERDQQRPDEWRPSDAPKSPTRVGAGSTPSPDQKRQS